LTHNITSVTITFKVEVLKEHACDYSLITKDKTINLQTSDQSSFMTEGNFLVLQIGSFTEGNQLLCN